MPRDDSSFTARQGCYARSTICRSPSGEYYLTARLQPRHSCTWPHAEAWGKLPDHLLWQQSAKVERISIGGSGVFIRPLSKDSSLRQTSPHFAFTAAAVISSYQALRTSATPSCTFLSKTPHPSELSQIEEIPPGLLKWPKREALLMIRPDVQETQRHTFTSGSMSHWSSTTEVTIHHIVEQGPIKPSNIEAAPLVNEGILSVLAFATCVLRYFTGMPFCRGAS